MEKTIDDYARDLALEFEVGGDRFDRSDMAYALYGTVEYREFVSNASEKYGCPTFRVSEKVFGIYDFEGGTHGENPSLTPAETLSIGMCS